MLTGSLNRLVNSLTMLDEVTERRIHLPEKRIAQGCIEPRSPLSVHSLLLNRNEVDGETEMVVGAPQVRFFVGER